MNKMQLEQPLSFPAYVDSSMLTAWRACRRKHYWAVLHALYPMGKSVHLIAGAAIAAGLEAARKTVFFHPEPRSVSHATMLEAAYIPYLLQWGDYTPDERSTKNFNTAWFALDHYLEYHPPATDIIQPYIRPDGSPAVEYKFAIPIDSIQHPDTREPLLFVGRFDMVGVMPMGTINKLLVVDEKTTGSLTYDWATKWDMRGQFIGYIWALRKQGFNVDHAAVRGIAILKTKNEVQTAITQYPNHIIDRWERQALRDMQDMVESYSTLKLHADQLHADEVLYPYNFGDSCESYGGCAFSPLCIANNPKSFFSNYIRHRFNPLEVQPVKEVAHVTNEQDN